MQPQAMHEVAPPGLSQMLCLQKNAMSISTLTYCPAEQTLYSSVVPHLVMQDLEECFTV